MMDQLMQSSDSNVICIIYISFLFNLLIYIFSLLKINRVVAASGTLP